MGFGKDNKGAILRESTSLTVGALSAGAASAVITDITTVEDFRILKSRVNAIITGVTAGEGVGLILGISNGNLTAAEIAACLVADGPVGPSDSVVADLAERACHLIAMTRLTGDGAATELNFEGFDGSLMIEDKHPWTYTDTDKWDWFVFNHSGASVTTGATVRILATHFGVWLV